MKMLNMEDFKYEFANINSGSYCQACLSTDRRLSSICSNDINILRTISNISFKNLPHPILLCWECMAVIMKIKQFRNKIEEAQKILTYHLVNKQKTVLKPLSKLTIIYTVETINIIHEDEKDFKQKIEIKQENYDSNDDYNNDNDFIQNNDISLQEIKKENTIDTKIKKKSLHYKIVCEVSKKVLRKKFTIPPNEAKIWLEKERNSDYYKEFKYKCKFCVQGFNMEDKLNNHILKYHDESIGQHICRICYIRFANDASLSAHEKAHELAWECARCGFQCYTIRRINAHISAHSAVQCAYCDAQFEDLATFYTHYKSLHSIFLCDDCGKRCKSKHMLEKHMSHHLETHRCTFCPRHYKSRAALRKHLAVNHSTTTPETAYCVLCDKQYTSRFVYQRHIQTSAAHAKERDTQVKKHHCPECNNVYSRRAYMMNHYRHVHMRESKYYCSECDRYFLNRTKYVDHMRYSHEGMKKEKNKLCNICGKGFAVNRTLVNHMRTHSGERPYECEFCSAKFTQRTSMLSHVKYVHFKSKRRSQWTQ